MIAVTIVEPVGKGGRTDEALTGEEPQGGLVVLGDDGIELMQMEDALGIVGKLADGLGSVALMTVTALNDDAHLSTTMLGREVDQVGNAHDLAPIDGLNDETHLPVGIGIARGLGDEVAEHIARIGHVADAHIPDVGVVLDAIEQVEVFGFHRPQAYLAVVCQCRSGLG